MTDIDRYDVIIEKINNLEKRMYERFDANAELMNAKFENIEDKIDTLNEKVAKQNGRVTKLEEKQGDMLRPSDIKVGFDKCEERFEKINKDIDDAKFFLRHPKVFIAGIVILVILTLATYINSDPLKVFKNETKIEYVKK